MPSYDISIDSPSTGNTVGSPFTVSGEVSSDDGQPFDFTVTCYLSAFVDGVRKIIDKVRAEQTGPGTWSASLNGSPNTYTVTASLYVSPNDPSSGSDDGNDSVSDVTISTGPAPIGIVSISDPPPPPGPSARVPAAAQPPGTRKIEVRGTCDPRSGVAGVTCVVTAEQDNNKKGSKHHYVVSAAALPARDFDVIMYAPRHGRFAVHAMAFRGDGSLLATSTVNGTKK